MAAIGTDSASLTTQQRLLSLLAINTSVFTWGISFAGLLPLLALKLETAGHSYVEIGILAAVTPIGVIIAAPYAPRLVQGLGTSMAIFLTNALSVFCVALLPIFDSYESWLVLRFISGIMGAVPWIVTESWINAIAPEDNRTRVTALYGATMAASFATGPFILTLIGTEGYMPFVYCTLAMMISIVPLVMIWKLAPRLNFAKETKWSGLVWTMPSLLAAALMCGLVDMSFFSLLPIWGLGLGFDKDFSVRLLSIFVMGNVVLQFPIGWIADRTNRRLILLCCGIAGIIGPFLVTALTGNLMAMCIVMFFWGGCAWALYTVSLAMLGERFQGNNLTAANAVFVIAYEIANIVGPPTAGVVMEIWVPHGLMGFAAVCAVAFVILICLRGIRRQQDDTV